jgi:hypothetical protein
MARPGSARPGVPSAMTWNGSRRTALEMPVGAGTGTAMRLDGDGGLAVGQAAASVGQVAPYDGVAWLDDLATE